MVGPRAVVTARLRSAAPHRRTQICVEHETRIVGQLPEHMRLQIADTAPPDRNAVIIGSLGLVVDDACRIIAVVVMIEASR